MREMRSRGVQMKAASALSEEAGLPGRETVRGDRVNGTAVPPAAEDARGQAGFEGGRADAVFRLSRCPLTLTRRCRVLDLTRGRVVSTQPSATPAVACGE